MNEKIDFCTHCRKETEYTLQKRKISCRDIVSLTLVHDDDKEEEFYVTYEEDELRCHNELQSMEFDSYGNLVIKIGKNVCSW